MRRVSFCGGSEKGGLWSFQFGGVSYEDYVAKGIDAMKGLNGE
ncbi:MAG: hypothetical protein QNL68_14115 [Akkermansiaceae bacterium]